ncbi:hypothetical protein HY641_05220 [Candidatus Woesearchaeota archaeon]|nr:hypothetical protein [Candidatus Woesearchaeota archaeon]
MELIRTTLQDINCALRRPRAFFSTETKSTGHAMGYVLTFFLVQSGLSLLFAEAFYQNWNRIFLAATGKVLPALAFTTTGYLLIFAALAVIGCLAIIISILLTHAYLRCIGGSRQSLGATSSAIAYGLTPSFVFGWIPYASFIAHLWSIVLVLLALRIKHPMPLWRYTLLIITLALAAIAAGLYLLGY